MRSQAAPIYLVVISALALAGAGRAADNPSIVRWARGTIEYRMFETGESIGSEQWHLTVHRDGSRTLQTVNTLDLAGAQRHVTLRVAESFRPLELMAVYFTGGEWRGSGFFIVDGNTLDATVSTPNGTIRQTRSVPDRFSFIPHPLAADAWGTWMYDRDRGGVQERTVYDLDSRAQAVSSMLGRVYSQRLELVGPVKVTTPAGTFATDHFRAGDDADIYLTGPDAILVRFVFSGEKFRTEFVLTSLETGEH